MWVRGIPTVSNMYCACNLRDEWHGKRSPFDEPNTTFFIGGLLFNISAKPTRVLSGETRFLRIRAYPEKIGAEAPEQPQNSRQSQKRRIFLSALALAAGAKQAGGNRTAAGHLGDHRITTQLLRR